MKWYNQIAILAACCAVSFSAGKFSGPAQETKKEEVKNEQQVQTDVNRTVKKKETVQPDGTRIIETESTTSKKTDSTSSSESKSETVVDNRPKFRVGAIYFPAIPNFQEQNAVFTVEKRFFSETYVGLSASTQQTIGVSISIGF